MFWTSQKECNNRCLNIEICSVMTEQTPSVHTGPRWLSLWVRRVAVLCVGLPHPFTHFMIQHSSPTSAPTTSLQEHTTQHRLKVLHCSIKKSNSIERLLGWNTAQSSWKSMCRTDFSLIVVFTKEAHFAVCVSVGLWSHRPVPQTGPAGINICLLNPS